MACCLNKFSNFPLQETVEAFLTRDNVTDEPDMEGRTALMWAAGKGAEKVIRTIVKYNTDINATDKTGATGRLNVGVCL